MVPELADWGGGQGEGPNRKLVGLLQHLLAVGYIQTKMPNAPGCLLLGTQVFHFIYKKACL